MKETIGAKLELEINYEECISNESSNTIIDDILEAVDNVLLRQSTSTNKKSLARKYYKNINRLDQEYQAKNIATIQQSNKNTSAYIIIPKPLKEYLKLNKGDKVLLEAREDGSLIVRK